MDYYDSTTLPTLGLDPRITRLCAQQDIDAWSAAANAEPGWYGIRGEADLAERLRSKRGSHFEMRSTDRRRSSR